MTLTPWMSAGATPAGKPGVVLSVGVPVMNTGGFAAQPVVQTSTWTRSAPLGKVTPASRTAVTESKNAGSVSVTCSRFRLRLPVFSTVSRTVTSSGFRPGVGRMMLDGDRLFCSDAPERAGPIATSSEQVGLFGVRPSMEVVKQFRRLPEVTPSRSSTVTSTRMLAPTGRPSGERSRTPLARAISAVSPCWYSTHFLVVGS